jgi:hypothetical protein
MTAYYRNHNPNKLLGQKSRIERIQKANSSPFHTPVEIALPQRLNITEMNLMFKRPPLSFLVEKSACRAYTTNLRRQLLSAEP